MLLKHIDGCPMRDVRALGLRPVFPVLHEDFFQHAFPHERSDLSHWRKRIGDKLELLLAESLRVAHEAGALRGQDLKRGPRCSRRLSPFRPMPSCCMRPSRALTVWREGTGSGSGNPMLAWQGGRDDSLPLVPCQTVQADQRQLRILRSRLGRIIRDIRRRIEDEPALEEAFALPLWLGRADPLATAAPAPLETLFLLCPEGGVHLQTQVRGALRVRVKASIVTNNRRASGGLVLHASAMPDNPYDGHTIERVYVDKGYRGHERAKSASRLHLLAEARRLRHHQARATPTLRHRTHCRRRPSGEHAHDRSERGSDGGFMNSCF